MQKRFYFWILITVFYLSSCTSEEKGNLYPNQFPLEAVKLLDGPFQHARDLNIEVLLKYDVDRLLAPYRKEAGLPEKAKGYDNWEGLAGHVGGHYLTAMAMNYAATGNEVCKQRMDYMLAELKACQEANGKNNPDWAVGYVGAVPKSTEIWSTLKDGEFSAYKAAWVPWYNAHKMYSGLRDAWQYTGNEEAKAMFLKFCDWGIQITSSLTDEQMESMLDTEHGGMNEVFADAYQLTKDEKYIVAAKRFSHRMLLEAMASHIDNLDNKHANTQVPKAVGFQRIAALTDDEKYEKAGGFFWETVTSNRTLAFGGNSRREFFPSQVSSNDFVNEVEGPESCNSYNMLKLTEHLFSVEPLARYADYFERTVYNHILSTQHPEHGGYVYFTPVRPQHYRVYSTPNEAMWCCVGSGMENHGKYNQFIYTHTDDSLFLNLFVASELTWKEKGVTLRQETKFPFEEKTVLKVTDGSSKFTLMIRYPSWVKEGALKVLVNGEAISVESKPSSYVAIERKWNTGDEVVIELPMHIQMEQLPNVPNYSAILYGPIVLAAKTGTEDLKGLKANDSRWGHIASGERLPVDQAPIILENTPSDIAYKLEPVEGKPLHFKITDVNMINSMNLELQPFFQLHDARYMMYWMTLSESQYVAYLDSIATVEKKKLELEKRTLDFVAPGEQQPEADHGMQQEKSRTGNNLNQFWRDAHDDGYFSYRLSTKGETNLSLMVRYWGAEWGSRKFDIYVDDEKLLTEDNTGKWHQSRFFDVAYAIPHTMLTGKKEITVKFQAVPKNTAGAVYYVRLVREKNK